MVFRRALADPGRVVLGCRTDQGAWRGVTAAQFRAQVADLAKGIMAAGIGPGDRVALMSRTRYEWTLADYAILAAGAITVPLYETSSAEQVRWILADSGARAVIAETGEHEEIITGVRGGLHGLEHLWMIDRLQVVASGGVRVADEQLDDRQRGMKAADLATIIYTSGTTGRPKGCAITHAGMLADVRNAVAALPEIFAAPGGASTLLFLPLAHSFARIIQFGVLEAGAVLGHWPDIGTAADGLAEFRPTFLLAVPRVFEKMYDRAQQQAPSGTVRARVFAAATDTAIEWSRALDMAAAGRGQVGLRLRHGLFGLMVYRRLRAAVGGRVRYAVSGGASLGERLGHFFRGVGITVLEGYGLTETTAAVTVNRPGRNKIGTVGQPLPGVSVRTAGDGQISVRGPNVFRGYWHDEAATREVLDADGWLRTGDIGALDAEGFLTVTGRAKELIITAGGTNVAPAPLEDRLRSHRLISQCLVVGDGRPYIACLVTLDPGALGTWKRQHRKRADATALDLAGDPDLNAEIQHAIDEANKAVSRAESIRRFKVLGTDFTEASGHLTPSAKVRRNLVERDFAADIDALYRSGS